MSVTFIAEIGMNHNGNYGLIYELIKQASYAGAEIAKFQLGWRAKEGEINALSEKEIALIYRCCERFSIQPMFSIFTQEALSLLEKFEVKHYKIASRTVNDNPELIRKIIAHGRPTYVSLGMWHKKERPFEKLENVHYFWCKSNYPAYPWELMDMPKDFETEGFIGYSDHSVGIDVPLMAIMRGARIIEKHFTLDKSNTTIRDHALSATPDEFRQLVQLGHLIRKNLDLGV